MHSVGHVDKFPCADLLKKKMCQSIGNLYLFGAFEKPTSKFNASLRSQNIFKNGKNAYN